MAIYSVYYIEEETKQKSIKLTDRSNNKKENYDRHTHVCSSPMHDYYCTLSKWGSKVLGKEVPIKAAVFPLCTATVIR